MQFPLHQTLTPVYINGFTVEFGARSARTAAPFRSLPDVVVKQLRCEVLMMGVSLQSIFRLTLLCLVLVSMSMITRAQQEILWRGVVKRPEVNVYTSASTGDAITRILKQGDAVDVVLEISAMGSGWCRVAFSGQSEALGYVLCLNLDPSGSAGDHIAHQNPIITESPATTATPRRGAETVPTSAATATTVTNKDVPDMNKIASPRLEPVKDGKIRIYVTDSQMFESTGVIRGSSNATNSASAAAFHTQAGDDPRTVEVQADIMKACSTNIIVTSDQSRADYALVFRRRGGARTAMFAFGGLSGLALSAGMKVDGASLFERNGDMVYATKKRTVESTIKDVCLHIPPQK